MRQTDVCHNDISLHLFKKCSRLIKIHLLFVSVYCFMLFYFYPQLKINLKKFTRILNLFYIFFNIGSKERTKKIIYTTYYYYYSILYCADVHVILFFYINSLYYKIFSINVLVYFSFFFSSNPNNPSFLYTWL